MTARDSATDVLYHITHDRVDPLALPHDQWERTELPPELHDVRYLSDLLVYLRVIDSGLFGYTSTVLYGSHWSMRGLTANSRAGIWYIGMNSIQCDR